MEWSSFWSAVVGGVLVIAGHFVVDILQRRSNSEERKRSDNRKIVSLVLDVVNWLEMDKHHVVDAAGMPMKSIEPGNPIHSLVALVRVSRPDLNDQAVALMVSSRRYFDLTRILIPKCGPQEVGDKIDEMANLANGMMVTLNTILEDASTADAESK